MTNKIYVATEGANTVTVIDGMTDSIVKVGGSIEPFCIGLNPMTNKIYVANLNGGGFVTVIDGSTYSATTVSMGPDLSYLGALAVNMVNNKIYMANASGNWVTILNGATDSTTTISVESGQLGFAINQVTNKIYVASGGRDTVTVIDGETDSTKVVIGGTGSNALAVNPVTNMIYVANTASNTITSINGVTNATGIINVGSGPSAIAMNSATNMIYVANGGSNTVTVINGATNAAITIPVGADPDAIAVNSMTNKIYVANYNSNNITIIDGATNMPSTINAGVSPVFVAVNSITNKIYVANDNSSNVTIIDGSSLPPAVPVLSTPSNGSSNLFLPITFSMEDDTCGVTSFVIEFSLSASFVQTTDIVINDSSAAIYSPYPNSTYFWRAKATNQYGTSAWSVTESFSTGNYLGPVTLLSPADNAGSVSPYPILQWTTVATANDYTVQISTSPFFNSYVYTTTFPGVSLTVDLASSNMKYYWRVCAVGAPGNGPFSVDSFTTASTGIRKGLPRLSPGFGFSGVFAVYSLTGRQVFKAEFPAYATKDFLLKSVSRMPAKGCYQYRILEGHTVRDEGRIIVR